MPVYGFVLDVAPCQTSQAQLFRLLRDKDWLMIGERVGSRLSVAMEASTLEEGEERRRWLLSVGGVRHLDVVFVDFSDVESVNRATISRRRRASLSAG